MQALERSTKNRDEELKRLPFLKDRRQMLVNVTPDMARQWLEYNTANRVITQTVLKHYTDEMRQGRWLDNGEAIKFAPGKLLDGQHRLEAIVQSGQTITLSIECGLQPETQNTMDTGRHRTARDVLSIEGLDGWQSRTLGTAIHTMIEVDRGGMVYSSMKHSNADARSYYLEHFAQIDNSLRTIQAAFSRAKPLMPASLAVVLHYLFSRKDEEQADAFFEKLFSGEGLSRMSPIWHLRNRLVSDAIQRTKRTSYERIGFVIKSWNSFRGGREMKSETNLYLKAGDAYPEIK